MSSVCGLFVAEDVGVKVADCIRSNEGGDEGNGPDNQNTHVAGAIGRVAIVTLGRIPVWCPAVACKHE